MKISFSTSTFPLVPLSEIVEVLDNLRKPINSSARRLRQGSFPYYGANGQVGTIDEYIFDDELVLVAEDGGFFSDDVKPIAYRVSGKCWVNNHAHVLKPKNNCDVDWLCYAICQLDVMEYIKGATRPKLNQKELLKIKIPLPSLEEQRRLISIVKEGISRVEESELLWSEMIAKCQELRNSLLYHALNGQI